MNRTITHVKVVSSSTGVDLEKEINGTIDKQLENGYDCVGTQYMTDAFSRMLVLLSFAQHVEIHYLKHD